MWSMDTWIHSSQCARLSRAEPSTDAAWVCLSERAFVLKLPSQSPQLRPRRLYVQSAGSLAMAPTNTWALLPQADEGIAPSVTTARR